MNNIEDGAGANANNYKNEELVDKDEVEDSDYLMETDTKVKFKKNEC